MNTNSNRKNVFRSVQRPITDICQRNFRENLSISFSHSTSVETNVVAKGEIEFDIGQSTTIGHHLGSLVIRPNLRRAV